MVKAITKR